MYTETDLVVEVIPEAARSTLATGNVARIRDDRRAT
jgi:hypothetical protein